jgi:uncharacterized protein YgbK (DUF1537 family)
MIVVVADDLTGAAELAAVALRHGLRAEVQTVFDPETDADVVCIDTDTRSLPPERAARAVEALVRRLVEAKPAWIFKKCDSVLRGPVLAEAKAMAGAAGKKRIMVLPANPARGRVIRQGNYFVQDQPLHETIFRHDPEYPRTTSSVAELLGGDLSGVSMPDVESAADVARYAAGIDEDTLPVGGVDFFAALLAARIPPRTVPASSVPAANSVSETLLVCGSAASWAARRTQAVKLDVPVFALPYDVVATVKALRRSRVALIGVGDAPATRALSPAALVDQLARSVAGVLRDTTVTRLLLEGGATAAAVMRAMGWTRLRAEEGSAQGVGGFRPLSPGAPMLFIKPGSYPWPREIWPGA